MQAYRIVESKQTLTPISNIQGWQTLTCNEARGIIWLFEEPKPNATYVVACDPAQGINGWDRTIPQDAKTDNSAIEVFRVSNQETVVKDENGKSRTVTKPMDYQVAEFAAPVDYEQTAAVVNALGRLFSNKHSKMGTAHTIIECYPGPGWMVEKMLISKYGYLNFYHRKYVDTLLPTESKGIGWVANRQSVRDLWIHGTRHVNNKSITIRSPWLLSEMKSTDPIKFQTYTSEAQSGFHDDRLRAAMLVWWAAHDLSSQIRVETTSTVEKNKQPTNWQASDLSADSLQEAWNKRFRDIMEGG